MSQELQNHPLNGVSLEDLLGELVRHYGWEILGEQININCFKQYPSFKSSLTYLRKTTWAREKLEAFYLYRFKQAPLPDDEQHALPPRNRVIDVSQLGKPPAEIELGAKEFFDDPVSGPKFYSKKPTPKKKGDTRRRVSSASNAGGSGESPDPWAKWRDKR